MRIPLVATELFVPLVVVPLVFEATDPVEVAAEGRGG